MSDRLADLVRQAMALDAERVSALDDAEARRKLLTRIVDQPLPPSRQPRAVGLAPVRRRRRWAVSLVGGTAVAVAAFVALGVPGNDPGPDLSTSGGADVFAGHQAAQSCVESYTQAALARRAFGFDGTVTNIGSTESTAGMPDGYVPVTFKVNRWFRGGAGPTVVVAMPRPEGSFGQDSTAYQMGSRLLVSGEPRYDGAPLADPIAWACGFTRSYTPTETAAWREVFH
ncbi:hypothetical protein ACIG87_24035 [Micromonospora sp. NPDC051925]|uniref:hypothetical protein n=1 Tax=Micromonospora sp. NPDC051925 TaxID=3364288 RepID=UPI0037C686C7